MVRVTLGVSARLGMLMSVGHLGAACVAAGVLPVAATVPVVLGVGLSWLAVWREHVARSSPTAVTGVELDGETVTVRLRDGRTQTGWAIARFVTPGVVILRLRCPGRWIARPVVIMPDAAGEDAHRRLRVWLKWGPRGADNPGTV